MQLFSNTVIYAVIIRSNINKIVQYTDIHSHPNHKTFGTIDRVPKKYFQHMGGTVGLYKFRIEVGSNIFRAFDSFDKGQLIVVANGFKKKTQKTHKNEIELAEKIKRNRFLVMWLGLNTFMVCRIGQAG